MGRPVIVSTDPDLNYFIFQQEGQLFQSWYPDTFTEIFGRQNVGSLHGFMYKYLKNMVLNLFGSESLKKMLPEVEEVAKNKLKRWSGQTSVEMKEATANVSLAKISPSVIKGSPVHKTPTMREIRERTRPHWVLYMHQNLLSARDYFRSLNM